MELLEYTIEFMDSDILNKEEIDQEATRLGMGKREIVEFWDKLILPDEQDFTLNMDNILDMDQENG